MVVKSLPYLQSRKGFQFEPFDKIRSFFTADVVGESASQALTMADPVPFVSVLVRKGP
jgi:hypothetical protein